MTRIEAFRRVMDGANYAATGHAAECEWGGYGMRVEIRVLTWALGEDFEMGNKVERFIKAASEAKP